MNGGALNAADVWHAATAWIDKELHRWGVCLLIVIAIHVGLISSFEAWRSVEYAEQPSGAMLIDLGPLPGSGSQSAGTKPTNRLQHATVKPLVQPEIRKHEHFHRLVKLRARIQRLLKPRPKVAEYISPRSAVSLPKPRSSTLVPTANAPAVGFGNIRTGSGTGSSVRPSDGCCGMGNGGVAGSGQSSPATWQGLLLADLEAHKRYPPEARERGEQGVVYLRFAMDRRGKVLSFSLEKSSGFGDLDQETLGLIERSQPLPPPPPTITGSVIELVVPVEFQLQQDN